MSTRIKNADLACGWCDECNTQIGDWPIFDPYWHVSKSLWLHTHGTGHKVRRISNDEAWAAVKAQQETTV
jgi:hypothetical protein